MSKPNFSLIYLHKIYVLYRCSLPEDDPKKVETCWIYNILILNYLCNNTAHFVGVVLYNDGLHILDSRY
jgi:hypothetical protein